MDKNRRLGYYALIETGSLSWWERSSVIAIVFEPRAVSMEGEITFSASIAKSGVFSPVRIPRIAN